MNINEKETIKTIRRWGLTIAFNSFCIGLSVGCLIGLIAWSVT